MRQLWVSPSVKRPSSVSARAPSGRVTRTRVRPRALASPGSRTSRCSWLLSWRPAYALNARFVKHLRSERPHLLTFLEVPGLAATNWPAETEIRPAVIARKLSGCNRTERGARAQERITTVARTGRNLGLDVFELLRQGVLAPGPIDLDLPLAPAT